MRDGSHSAMGEFTTRAPGAVVDRDGEHQLDLVGLGVLGDEVGGREVRDPGGDAGAHHHRPARIVGFPAQFLRRPPL
ncbi:MAG TPA: hypothetical protein VIZ91_10810 [Solirubrobacterales bacterium]